MLDPFPFAAPRALAEFTQRYQHALGFTTLHLHIHEILLAIVGYHLIYKVGSPWLSARLCPRTYAKLDWRTKLNWDVHVVSLVQSTMIILLAVYVTVCDEERWRMDARERVWGYTGASALIVAFAVGYFLWDLWVSIWYVKIFGPGLVAHAVSALTVYSFGFRPFVNWYAAGFILFELSSPFLNFHWFLDKLDMTGSNTQLVNGIVLMATFFGSRLIWGVYLSLKVFHDMYLALRYQASPVGKLWIETLASDVTAPAASAVGGDAAGEVFRFAQNKYVPLWMAGLYLASNLTLMYLNVVWFGKMIETIRRRFDPPFGTRRPDHKHRPKVPGEQQAPVMGKGLYADGTKTVELATSEVKRRNPPARMLSDAPPPS